MNRDELLAQWLEGGLDGRGCAMLLRELEADTAFARAAAEQLRMKRLLGTLATGEMDFARELSLRLRGGAPADGEAEGRAVIIRLQQRRRWQRAGLAAAGLAAAAAVVLLLALWPRPGPPIRVLASEGVRSLDIRALNAAQTLVIGSGLLELALGTKSRLVIEGPAEFALESASTVRLFSGRCYAEMEKGASGLRIRTPSGEVLDLGTRFGVEVLPGRGTAVHVFEGAVELGGGGRRARLRGGEGVNWSEQGGLSAVPVEPARFVSRLPGATGGPTRWLHWAFDEREGDVTRPAGTGFPGGLQPAQIHGAQWSDRDGSGALEFDGVDDWVETGFEGIAAGADRTVAAWVKLAADFGTANGQAIVGWGDFNIQDPNRRHGAAWELGIGDTVEPRDISGRLKVAVGGPLTVGHADLRDGRWHHVAAVHVGNGAPDGRGIVLLYVDGELQRRTFGTARMRLDTDVRTEKAEPVQFGRQVMRASPEREFFKGAIDDAFITDTALNGDAIRALMQTGFPP